MTYLGIMRDVLPREAFIVEEISQVGIASWYGFPVYEPRKLVTGGYMGNLGHGFQTSLGVKVANPDTPVVSIKRRWRLHVRRAGTGDGGAVQDRRYCADLHTTTHLATYGGIRSTFSTIVCGDPTCKTRISSSWQRVLARPATGQTRKVNSRHYLSVP